MTRVVASGGRITGRYIDLVQSRGSYTGRMLAYARDTQSVKRSGDGGEVYTAAYGLGATVDDAAVTFSAVVWETGSGDPADKDNGVEWVGDAGALDVYGLRDDDGTVTHRWGVFRDTQETDDERLLEKTWAWLQEHKQPRFTYDVGVAAIESYVPQESSLTPIMPGDLVIVRDTRCQPSYTAEVRVTEVTRSYSDPTRDSFVFGEPKKRLADYMREIRLLKRTLNR